MVSDFSKDPTAFSYTSNIVGDFGSTGTNKVLPAWDGAPNNPNGRPTPQDVTVWVKHIEDPASIAVTDENGTTVASNPITGEDYDSVSGSHTRAHALWFTTTTKQNNFHFMTVIYPQNPADKTAGPGGTPLPNPNIQRINDYTARVTNPDGTVDVISFDPTTAAANSATIVVNLLDINPMPVVDDTLINSTVNPYTITASAGTGGTITPSGAISVNSGASQTFTVTANTGYTINQVLVDGNAVTLTAGSYTLTNVTANHTIMASFIPTYTLTITSANGSVTKSPLVRIVLHFNRIEQFGNCLIRTVTGNRYYKTTSHLAARRRRLNSHPPASHRRRKSTWRHASSAPHHHISRRHLTA